MKKILLAIVLLSLICSSDNCSSDNVHKIICTGFNTSNIKEYKDIIEFIEQINGYIIAKSENEKSEMLDQDHFFYKPVLPKNITDEGWSL